MMRAKQKNIFGRSAAWNSNTHEDIKMRAEVIVGKYLGKQIR
jgi:hypothetical protein